MKLSEIIEAKGTYIFCPRCGSPAVSHTRPKVEDHENVRTEIYDVKCAFCGLHGRIEENWFWEKGKGGE